MQIWDTAGQERFKTITQTYYKGANGIVLAYSVTDRESFQNIDNWMKQIRTHANEDVSLIIVATKADMQSDRVVTFDEGKALADSYGLKFFETSAKQDLNVKDALLAIAKDIKDKIGSDKLDKNGGNEKIELNRGHDPKKNQQGCC
jgi:Ras-related protein Rab-8A